MAVACPRTGHLRTEIAVAISRFPLQHSMSMAGPQGPGLMSSPTQKSPFQSTLGTSKTIHPFISVPLGMPTRNSWAMNTDKICERHSRVRNHRKVQMRDCMPSWVGNWREESLYGVKISPGCCALSRPCLCNQF